MFAGKARIFDGKARKFVGNAILRCWGQKKAHQISKMSLPANFRALATKIRANFAGKAICGSWVIGLDKARIFVGKARIFVSKVRIFVGKTRIFVGRARIFVGKARIFMGRP